MAPQTERPAATPAEKPESKVEQPEKAVERFGKPDGKTLTPPAAEPQKA